jgi:putative component of membrane protein insertase Oxa1/YidC/SpoIIIJ protein YidD
MVNSVTTEILKALTRVMRPLFGIAGVCRYTVTCSAYARYALQQYPLPKAVWYSVKRVMSCTFLFGKKSS